MASRLLHGKQVNAELSNPNSAVRYSLELDTDLDVINVILTKLVFPPDVCHIEEYSTCVFCFGLRQSPTNRSD